MTPVNKSKSSVNSSDNERTVDTVVDAIPSKKEILEDIREGYVYIMSGGVGQPIEDVHREIAEELALEEFAENADFRP